MTEDKNKPKPKGGLVLSTLLPAVTDLTKRALPKLEMKASAVAGTGSVAVSGDNLGSIVNVNARTLIIERQIARELPSYLSKVVLISYKVQPLEYGAPDVVS